MLGITRIVSRDPQALLDRYYGHFLNVRELGLGRDSSSKVREGIQPLF